MVQPRIVYSRRDPRVPIRPPKRSLNPRQQRGLNYSLAIAAVLIFGAYAVAAGWPKATPTITTIIGPARILDGDTVAIREQRIRLLGLDAPESDQECERGGKVWRCGEAAKAALERLADGEVVRCDVKGHDRYGRALAVCQAGGVDLAAELMVRGLAVTYGSGTAYRAQEAAAMVAGRGLWAGDFVRPAEWRRGER